MNNRGTVLVEVLVVLLLLGGGLFVAKPDLIPGTESYRAKKSAQSTTQLSTAITNADTAAQKQGAEVAAGLVAIERANDLAPASNSKNFIGQEVPHLRTLLPSPDPKALIEAEKRRTAVMEGRYEEAKRLYEDAAAKAAQLIKERDTAIAARNQAEYRRQLADQALLEAAAAAHARTVMALGVGAVCLVLLAAYIWLKFNSVSLPDMGKIVADVKAGANPIQAFDTFVDARLHKKIQREAKLAGD